MRRHPCLFALALVAALFCVLPVRATEPFKVLVYNVENWLTTDRFVDNKPVKSAPKPEEEKEAVVGIIAAQQPAIVGLVEMGNKEDLADIRTRLKARGLDYPHSEWHQGLDTARHVALLSKYPIVERHSRDITFELNGQPQGVQRGVLDVVVEVSKDYRLRLIGLHLKSRRPVKEFDEAALRAKEAWHVRQYVTEILQRDPKTRLLLYGDLNDTKNTYPIRELLGPRNSPTRLMDIFLADSRGHRWTHYWRTADEYARIDFIMVNPELFREIDRDKSGVDDSENWNDASDHRAIYVTIDPAKR